MILRAENILGGTLITLHWERAPDRVQSAVVLNAHECRLLAAAIFACMPCERPNDFTLVWNGDRDSAQMIIGTDSITIPMVNMFEMKAHIEDRNANVVWQFGASQT